MRTEIKDPFGGLFGRVFFLLSCLTTCAWYETQICFKTFTNTNTHTRAHKRTYCPRMANDGRMLTFGGGERGFFIRFSLFPLAHEAANGKSLRTQPTRTHTQTGFAVAFQTETLFHGTLYFSTGQRKTHELPAPDSANLHLFLQLCHSDEHGCYCERNESAGIPSSRRKPRVGEVELDGAAAAVAAVVAPDVFAAANSVGQVGSRIIQQHGLAR